MLLCKCFIISKSKNSWNIRLVIVIHVHKEKNETTIVMLGYKPWIHFILRLKTSLYLESCKEITAIIQISWSDSHGGLSVQLNFVPGRHTNKAARRVQKRGLQE